MESAIANSSLTRISNQLQGLQGLLGGGGGGIPRMQARAPRVFQRQFKAYSVACANNFKPNMENGDKILLPPSAFNELGRCLITYPMMFQIGNPANGARTHCGVMEFTAPEGMAYLPYWMMSGLCLQNGSVVDIRSATLKKGTFVKFQPHKTKFTTLTNPRVVLEKALRSFSCLTQGSMIEIKHGTQKFYLDVLETKPGNAITIIDTDVNVDFAPPKDYKESKARGGGAAGSSSGGAARGRSIKPKADDGLGGGVWGASFKPGSRKTGGSSYFKNLKQGNTLSGRKPPKRAVSAAARPGDAKAPSGAAGWGASSPKSPRAKKYKAFSGKGYSLK